MSGWRFFYELWQCEQRFGVLKPDNTMRQGFSDELWQSQQRFWVLHSRLANSVLSMKPSGIGVLG